MRRILSILAIAFASGSAGAVPPARPSAPAAANAPSAATTPAPPGASAPPSTSAHPNESQPAHEWVGQDVGPGMLLGIAWSGSGFVAVGHDTLLWSRDALSWKRVETPGRRNLEAVAWGAGVFVAVGGGAESAGPAVLTSPDGETWTERPAPGRRALSGVAWSGDAFVAVGSDTILSSPDGLEWKEEDPSADGEFRSIAWSGRSFVVVGRAAGTERRPLVLTSPNGRSWTPRDASGAGLLDDVAWTGDRFIAVGRGVYLTSPDGEEWAEQKPPAEDEIAAIAGNTLHLVAVGKAAKEKGGGRSDGATSRPILLASQDGTAWRRETLESDGALAAIVWNGDRFVAVGQVRTDTRPHALIVTRSSTVASVPGLRRTYAAAPAPGPGPAPSGPAPGPAPTRAPRPPRFRPGPAPGTTPTVCGKNPGDEWKNGRCFAIERVDGVEPVYDENTKMTLKVLGRTVNADVDPEPKNGFCVQGYISHEGDAATIAGANGVWDEKLRGWYVQLPVPPGPREGYTLWIALYCCQDGSVCADTYGRAAQANATYTFDVP